MKKILTLVIDGIGESDKEFGNAIKSANMPNYDKLKTEYPSVSLLASGPDVGLAEGIASNELIGYKTLSAGEVLKQKSSYMHDFIAKDNLAVNTALKLMIANVKRCNSTVHVMGLMSDGGLISNIDDTIELIKFLKEQNIKIVIDFISDGIDVEPKTALKYIERLNNIDVPIATICGRYYAMDENEKWDRTKIYYDLVRKGTGLNIKEVKVALKNCYMRNITDAYLPPMILMPNSNIKDNDAVIWVNFDKTGAKQILTAITNPDVVKAFDTKPLVNMTFLIMYPVDSKINATVLINEEDDTSNSLGVYLSKLGLTQARIASKENFEYVTYYFNGELTDKPSKCSNYLIDRVDNSEKAIQLEQANITKQAIKCMERDVDFILCSLDGVQKQASSGKFDETVSMLEVIDLCLGKIVEQAELNFYTIVLLSTHGNAENMISDEKKALTTNTTNKVPLIITDKKLELTDGCLTGVARAILEYMDISVPDTMKESKKIIK